MTLGARLLTRRHFDRSPNACWGEVEKSILEQISPLRLRLGVKMTHTFLALAYC